MLTPQAQPWGKGTLAPVVCAAPGDSLVGATALDAARSLAVVASKLYVVDPKERVLALQLPSLPSAKAPPTAPEASAKPPASGAALAPPTPSASGAASASASASSASSAPGSASASPSGAPPLSAAPSGARAAGVTCELAFAADVGAQGVIDTKPPARHLSAAGEALVVSNDAFGAVLLRGATPAYSCSYEPAGLLSVHPLGTWGLAFFGTSDVSRVSLGASDCKSEKWALTGLPFADKRKGPFESVSAVGFANDLVIVGGSVAKELLPARPVQVGLFDLTGKETKRFGSPDPSLATPETFRWVHAVRPCEKNNVCVLDGGANRLSMWSREGVLLASVDLTQLFGHKQVFAQDFVVTKDAAYVAVAIPRDGVRVADGYVVALRGLAP